MKFSVGATLVVLCLVFLLGASGARLPYSAAIIAGEESASRLSPEKLPAEAEINSTHHAIPVDFTLPFSCQQQGCGPDVACPGSSSIASEESADDSSANCYLYQGMFLCCTISPLGSRR